MARTAAQARMPRADGTVSGGAPDAGGPGAIGDVDGIVGEIGPRVKALRTELGLSLQQMSAIAEVSAASIHKIERGDMVPTITTLLKLAAAFRRPISYFIDEQPGDLHDAWHTPRGAGPAVPAGPGVETALVSGPAVRFRSEAQVTRLAAGSRVTETGTRPGETLLFVVSGAVDADVAGRGFALRKGDTLHYLSDRTVTLACTGKTPAEILRVTLAHT